MAARKILYISSPGHSGSTLLTFLLAAHPRIVTIGELANIFSRVGDPAPGPMGRCSCGRSFLDCAFMRQALDAGLEALPGGLQQYDFGRFELSKNGMGNKLFRRAYLWACRLGLPLSARPFNSRVGLLAAANTRVIDHLMDSPGAEVFLDSSKSTIRLNFLLTRSEFDIFLIRLKRDGRGQFHSMLKRYPGTEPSHHAAQFVKTDNSISGIFHRLPAASRLEIKYEELCEDPSLHVSRIFEAAGLDNADVSGNFRHFTPHMIGNAEVLENGSGAISNPELWRKELTPAQLEVFETIAGPVNRRLGYDD